MLVVNLQILKKFSRLCYTSTAQARKFGKMFLRCLKRQDSRGSGSNSDNDGVWVFTQGVTWFSKAVKLEVVSGRFGRLAMSGEQPGYYLLVRY